MKLFSWRRSITRALPSNPIRLIAVSRLLSSHSPPVAAQVNDFDDPAFSPVPTAKTPKINNNSKLNKTKKIPPSKIKNNRNNFVDADKRVPVKSELPFDYRYSYSEISPVVEPIGFREPRRFSPFGPGRIDRKWTGTCAPAHGKADVEKLAEERERVLGEPLSDEEIAELVEKYRHSNCARQINLGQGGVTHNTLVDIHNHWKRAEAVRIKCLGVPTLDMDNICLHLEVAVFVGQVWREDYIPSHKYPPPLSRTLL